MSLVFVVGRGGSKSLVLRKVRDGGGDGLA